MKMRPLNTHRITSDTSAGLMEDEHYPHIIVRNARKRDTAQHILQSPRKKKHNFCLSTTGPSSQAQNPSHLKGTRVSCKGIAASPMTSGFAMFDRHENEKSRTEEDELQSLLLWLQRANVWRLQTCTVERGTCSSPNFENGLGTIFWNYIWKDTRRRYVLSTVFYIMK